MSSRRNEVETSVRRINVDDVETLGVKVHGPLNKYSFLAMHICEPDLLDSI